MLMVQINLSVESVTARLGVYYPSKQSRFVTLASDILAVLVLRMGFELAITQFTG